MSKNRKRKQRSNRPKPHEAQLGDVHLALQPVADPIAWAQSVGTDAVDDREWFKRHPEADCRKRLITPLEMKTTGLPPLTDVVVLRDSDGSQWRLFLGPRNPLVPVNN